MDRKKQKLNPEKIEESSDHALNINALPNEMILKIFGYLEQNQLGQIARVCKTWNVLTKSSLLWKKVNVIFSPFHRSQMTVAKSFINGLPTCVTSIRLDFMEYCDWYDSLNFEELCLRLQERCPHLEKLTLANSEISDDPSPVIDVCTQFLQDIKNLIFHYTRFGRDCSTDECFSISKIEILELFYCYLDHPSKSPFSKMPHLKQLHLFGTNVDDSWFEDDISFLNQLHVLNLGNTEIITTETFQAIQNHGLNLKELYICGSWLLNSEVTLNNSVFPHLKTICLFNTYVTCQGVVSIIQSCPSLENVYVSKRVAKSFAVHPFVVANRCMEGIVKTIVDHHDHQVNNLQN